MALAQRSITAFGSSPRLAVWRCAGCVPSQAPPRSSRSAKRPLAGTLSAPISCADVTVHPLPPAGHETGIDVGLKGFLITAAGEVGEHPRRHRRGEQQLAQADKRVSRRKK